MNGVAGCIQIWTGTLRWAPSQLHHRKLQVQPHSSRNDDANERVPQCVKL
jgi:hypothetical protein